MLKRRVHHFFFVNLVCNVWGKIEKKFIPGFGIKKVLNPCKIYWWCGLVSLSVLEQPNCIDVVNFTCMTACSHLCVKSDDRTGGHFLQQPSVTVHEWIIEHNMYCIYIYIYLANSTCAHFVLESYFMNTLSEVAFVLKRRLMWKLFGTCSCLFVICFLSTCSLSSCFCSFLFSAENASYYYI